MDLDLVRTLAFAKTPITKVNVYTPSKTEGKGEGGAAPWDTVPTPSQS
jgi:hypothetical protein